MDLYDIPSLRGFPKTPPPPRGRPTTEWVVLVAIGVISSAVVLSFARYGIESMGVGADYKGRVAEEDARAFCLAKHPDRTISGATCLPQPGDMVPCVVFSVDANGRTHSDSVVCMTRYLVGPHGCTYPADRTVTVEGVSP